MRPGASWIIAAAVIVAVAGTGAGIRLAVTADPVRRARAREVAAAVAQYGLLFGFAAVAAAISAHGLTGFARANMGLRGAWPYLLWAALDGAAGLCAVLLMRRAARGESSLAPRLAVWGLVAASALFNWTHAPDHPGARTAFALMPVIAAMLFEFSLRETRHTARAARRVLAGPGWVRPGERFRAWMMLSADASISAEAALRQARVERAAWRLHMLRQALAARERAAGPRAVAGYRVRRADARAQAGLVRARFTVPDVAAEVLRQVQVLTLPQVLAGLDYSTADHAMAVLGGMIAPDSGVSSVAGRFSTFHLAHSPGANGNATPNGCPAASGMSIAAADPLPQAASGSACLDMAGIGNSACPHDAASRLAGQCGPGLDSSLVDTAARMVAETRAAGGCLSQAELARRLRAEGYRIANGRLRWLSAVSGLQIDGASR